MNDPIVPLVMTEGTRRCQGMPARWPGISVNPEPSKWVSGVMEISKSG
ncbi:MAG: hypothetical protein WBG50_24695 [Desulfomonilaceae bacterium]